MTVAVCTLVWAIWPLGDASQGRVINIGVAASDGGTPHGGATVKAHAPTLDLAAFNAPLWVHPPAMVVATTTPPPPPPPPLRAQLLAITTALASDDGNDHGRRAIFYDEAKDTLVTVSVGDEVAGRRVTVVDVDGVTLEQNNRTQRLDLRPKRDRRPLGATAAEDLAALMGRPWPMSHSAMPTPDPLGNGGAGGDTDLGNTGVNP